MSQGLRSEVVRDQRRLDELADEWDELYARCPVATPFQSHAWNASWARAYCPPGRLRVVVVRSADRLEAVAPLCLVRRGPWSVLVPLGGRITDYVDLLVQEPRGAALAALTEALLAEPDWHAIDLRELRPESAAVASAEHWPGTVTTLEDSPSLELPARPLEELLARVPGRTANTLRRKLRRVDAAGVTVDRVPAEKVPDALPAMLALHREQWRGRGINPEHETARFAAHLGEAVARMARTGQAVAVEYRLEGELLAGQLHLLGHDFLGYYLAGVSPRLKERVDVASMLIRNDVELTVASGLSRYSMLRGREDFKLRWRPDEVRNRRLLLARPGMAGTLGYAAVAQVRGAAVRLAKRRAPWLRSVKRRWNRPAGRRGEQSRLLVVHPGAELYGTDRMLLASVAALLAGGRRVLVVLPGDGPLVAELVALGAEVVRCRMPVLRRSALRPSGAWELGREATAGLRPAVRLLRASDSVYVSTLTIPSWVLLARLLRRPVTCHVHEAERSAPGILRRLLAWPVSLADQVVVNSEFTRLVLEEAAPRSRGRATVVHNGVVGPHRRPPVRQRLEGAVRLLYLGRLSPRKGPQVAVAALAHLRARGIDARLDLVGAVFPGYEWFETELRDAVRRASLGSQVRFLGFRPDIWPEVSSADIVLVPSIAEESFGNTAVEAVLAGRPLVVSATSGLLEAVAGFASVQAVTPDAPEEIADAVERIVGSWAEYAGRAADDAVAARRRFSPERYGEEIVRVLLHGNGRG